MTMEVSPAKMMKMEIYADDDDDDVALCFPAKRKNSTATIFDDDEILCFPAKRKSSSTAEIVDEDTKISKKEKRKKKYSEEELEAWFNAYEITYGGEVCIDYSRDESDDGLPIKHNGDFFKEELDISGAAFVEVDGRKSENNELLDLVHFATRCRQKCYLQKFSFPGEPGSEGSLSATSYMLFPEDCDVAVTALKEYQKVKQNAKLKLREIMKVNYEGSVDDYSYITFSAEDEMTGETSTYQAALFNCGDRNFLGLLRNVDDDKVLAILSVKGTEEDLTAFAADEDEFWRTWEKD